MGGSHAGSRPHRLRRGAQRHGHPDAASPTGGRAHVRARAVAARGPGCRPAGGGAGGRSPGTVDRGRRLMKRTGVSALLLLALVGAAAGFLVDHLLTAGGRPTFVPSILLAVLM